MSAVPTAPAGRGSLTAAGPTGPAAAGEATCTITHPGDWNYYRFGYCLSGLSVLYTLKDSNGRVVGTGTLTVATSAFLPAGSTKWDESITVTMTGATDAVTSLTAKFKAQCSSGCKMKNGTPWYNGDLVKGKSVSGTVSYGSDPAPGTSVDFTTSYTLAVTSPGAQPTDPYASWTNPEKIRCDDNLRDISIPDSKPPAGCVVRDYTPVVRMSTSTSGAAAAGYLWAQENLSDGWGRNKPLTRARSGADGRTNATCEGSQPFEAIPEIVTDDTCEAFPFGASHEGGTDGAQCAEIIPASSGGEWHIHKLRGVTPSMPCVRAHVPAADHQSARTQLDQGFAEQRVVEGERFNLEVTGSSAQPQAACLRTRPEPSLPSSNGWINNTTEPVAQRNKNTTPPGPAGIRATKAEACLGKAPRTGSEAVGDITGWQDAQIFARPLAEPGTKAPYGLGRCHLIANILGGKGRVRDGGQNNLVPCWQSGMNTGTPSMRTFEFQAQKFLDDDNFGANDAIFYEVTPHYSDATSTVPDGVTMRATVQRADGTSQPLFQEVYVSNTKGSTGLFNLGN
ncbi:DNA/RNA non-specific endonuclease [Kitasatospora purpeofusca]|uniref:DNA/RNA non-specific endonuclease n=1 Tax=Kitasatospora purpeofusca TaxID=67352 RepID=UPI002E0DADD0|nr:DNA/RNA non-specific endonuclease [Kitasatospora purpeofusca]WSR37853.1 DNA/RNA non-specific endonuclease [Kitasatospora purpeofusca]